MSSNVLNSSVQSQSRALANNAVVRNTYILLSMTLLFSAFSASVSLLLKLPHPGLLLTLAGCFGLLFATARFRNSNIIHCGESNYIMATVSLFVALFDLFTSLLHLIGFTSGQE